MYYRQQGGKSHERKMMHQLYKVSSPHDLQMDSSLNCLFKEAVAVTFMEKQKQENMHKNWKEGNSKIRRSADIQDGQRMNKQDNTEQKQLKSRAKDRIEEHA